MTSKLECLAFEQRRRQQFLDELVYQERRQPEIENIANQNEWLIHPPLDDEGNVIPNDLSMQVFRTSMIAMSYEVIFWLEYTAGEPIEPLRQRLQQIIEAYERYIPLEREEKDDPDYPALLQHEFLDYFKIIQLISLCYLLHRRDLLPRLASLVCGPGETYAGEDALVEDLLAYEIEGRPECDDLIYGDLYVPVTSATRRAHVDEVLSDLQPYVKNWYTNHKGALWHDSHLPGSNWRYEGYWCFEAAAVAYLQEIDDSSLHQYLYYPKDIVAFARSYTAPTTDDLMDGIKP